jgi:opacity protein-like surface antigen
MYSKLTLTACIIAATTGFSANAQLSNKGFEAAASLSGYIYQGDLTPSRFGSYRTIRPGIGISGSRFFNSFFSVRAGLNVGWLHGDDAKYSSPEYRKERSFSFNSTIIEVSAVAVYNIAGTNGNNTTRRLSPYVFAGLGFNFLNTAPNISGFNAEYFGGESRVITGLAIDMAHGPTRRLPVIPVGAGVRYPISNNLSLALETNYRVFFTDYLDGFSQSAGPSAKDHYYTHTASVIYTFNNNKGMKCPVIRP